MNREPAHSISKRGRAGEGRPTKRTPEVVAKIAEAVAIHPQRKMVYERHQLNLTWPLSARPMTGWDWRATRWGACNTAERLLMRDFTLIGSQDLKS